MYIVFFVRMYDGHWKIKFLLYEKLIAMPPPTVMNEGLSWHSTAAAYSSLHFSTLSGPFETNWRDRQSVSQSASETEKMRGKIFLCELLSFVNEESSR